MINGGIGLAQHVNGGYEMGSAYAMGGSWESVAVGYPIYANAAGEHTHVTRSDFEKVQPVKAFFLPQRTSTGMDGVLPGANHPYDHGGMGMRTASPEAREVSQEKQRRRWPITTLFSTDRSPK